MHVLRISDHRRHKSFEKGYKIDCVLNDPFYFVDLRECGDRRSR